MSNNNNNNGKLGIIGVQVSSVATTAPITSASNATTLMPISSVTTSTLVLNARGILVIPIYSNVDVISLSRLESIPPFSNMMGIRLQPRRTIEIQPREEFHTRLKLEESFGEPV